MFTFETEYDRRDRLKGGLCPKIETRETLPGEAVSPVLFLQKGIDMGAGRCIMEMPIKHIKPMGNRGE